MDTEKWTDFPTIQNTDSIIFKHSKGLLLDKRTHSNATFIKLQEWNPEYKIFKLVKLILFSH